MYADERSKILTIVMYSLWLLCIQGKHLNYGRSLRSFCQLPQALVMISYVYILMVQIHMHFQKLCNSGYGWGNGHLVLWQPPPDLLPSLALHTWHWPVHGTCGGFTALLTIAHWVHYDYRCAPGSGSAWPHLWQQCGLSLLILSLPACNSCNCCVWGTSGYSPGTFPGIWPGMEAISAIVAPLVAPYSLTSWSTPWNLWGQ